MKITPIFEKVMVHLKNPKTFAYTPKIGVIGETQLRLYTSYSPF